MSAEKKPLYGPEDLTPKQIERELRKHFKDRTIDIRTYEEDNEIRLLLLRYPLTLPDIMVIHQNSKEFSIEISETKIFTKEYICFLVIITTW